MKSKKIKITIPDDVNILIHRLQENGFSAYIVGGCVRDSILGRVPHDWDICTSAKPSDIILAFSDKRVIETGLQHGTLTVVENSIPYEITTFRKDGTYSDNRRPDSVEFVSDLMEDLNRRDFTINAMAYNDKEGLLDPFNGMKDIKHKIIRCVGKPEDRFTEDALRILRAWRFSCQLPNFEIEDKTLSSMYDLISMLKNVSIERIHDEFVKAFDDVSGFVINSINRPIFLNYIIPEFKDMRFPQNNPYHIYYVDIHTWNALLAVKECDFITRLAVLFHDIGKPHCYQDGEDGVRHFKGHGKVSASMTDAIMKRLKFDNDTREKVVELINYHDATFEIGHKYIKRWLNKIGEEQFRRLLNLHEADVKAQNPLQDAISRGLEFKTRYFNTWFTLSISFYLWMD